MELVNDAENAVSWGKPIDDLTQGVLKLKLDHKNLTKTHGICVEGRFKIFSKIHNGCSGCRNERAGHCPFKTELLDKKIKDLLILHSHDSIASFFRVIES